MLEQLQTGASSEVISANIKKGDKTGKAGVFSNLFSALTLSKGKAAKGHIAKTVGVEENISLKSALKLISGKTANQSNVKTAHNKKISALQTQQSSLATPSAKQKHAKENVTVGIALPVVNTADIIKKQSAVKATQSHQTDSSKENMRDANKRAAHAASLLTLVDKNEKTSQTAKQTAAPINDKQDKNVATTRAKENARTDRTPGTAAQGFEKAINASLHSSNEQQTRLHQNNSGNDKSGNNNPNVGNLSADKLKNNKLQNAQIGETNKHRQDTQTSITQQALLAARLQTNNVKPEHAQRSAASPSAANGSTSHAALVNLLNQNAGQFADSQQGNTQFGHGQNNNSAADLTARQDVADSRFSGLLQSDSRSPSGPDGNLQRFVTTAYPLKALEAMHHIAQSAKNGATRLELQLEPAHLGKIHISLQTDAAKQLQMHLTVEQAVTRQVIEQHLPQLRTALEQQGLSLDQFSLQTGSQQQHAAQDQGFSDRTDEQAQPNDGTSAPAQSETPANIQTAAHGRLSIHI
ncbi:MAG: flagellar hook-length control protein FliK [Mariprofundaceae bacterium]|nr:flagellar hook-length control protein FliK [Mariprofundaceae bacterium]